MSVAMSHCSRARGGSVRDCVCRLADEAGWAECPPETLGVPSHRRAEPPSFSGDICVTCGGTQMIRTGTCLTCLNCGSSDGGCS